MAAQPLRLFTEFARFDREITMKKLLALVALMSIHLQAQADVFAVFRNDDGSTRWQYVANTSASLLIIILAVVLAFMVRAHLRALRYNRALKDMKSTLEQRVQERTAALQKSNDNLRQREAYITSIVDSMPVMLIGLNSQLEVTQWNRVAETITGRPLNDVRGLNLWKAYSAITLTPEQVQQVLESKQTLTVKHYQRGQYSFDITVYALGDDNETGLVILVSDVTKQVNAETKLAERDKVSAMGELASAMAYDISLPINTIFSRVLSARHEIEASNLGEVKGVLLREVETVRQSAQRATAIAQNLLDLVRAHRDERQSAEVPQVMDQAIALAGCLFGDVNRLRFEDIRIERNYASNLPAVSCYPAELQQVFVRLLRSAFYALNSASKQEGFKARMTIEISEFYETLWISLQHNGTCLSAEEQLEIFQPYFALNTSAAAYPPENRLSYSYFIIADHHQGQMAVTSTEEHGTRFHIQLPL